MQWNMVKNQMRGGVTMETTTVEGFSTDYAYYYTVLRKPILKKTIINSFMIKYHANKNDNTKIAYSSALSNFLDAMPKAEDGRIILIVIR